jgi:glycyl-tRNA synthetase beta subunit
MYYQEQAIDKAVVRAVLAKKGSNNVAYDWHLRIEAVHIFVQNENSKSLIEPFFANTALTTALSIACSW